VLHALRLNECESATLVSVIFSPSLFSGGIGSKLYLDLVLPVLADTERDIVIFHPHVEWEREALDCVHRVRELYDTGSARSAGSAATAGLPASAGSAGTELLICGALARFWHLLLNHEPSESAGMKSLSIKGRKRIKAMLSHIEQHFSEPVTLTDIAAAANISTRECTRCFRSVIGETPFGYLTRVRVSAAAAMLAERDCTVTEAAMACGFDNLSYFAKVFRRAMGITPKAYQQQAGRA